MCGSSFDFHSFFVVLPSSYRVSRLSLLEHAIRMPLSQPALSLPPLPPPCPPPPPLPGGLGFLLTRASLTARAVHMARFSCLSAVIGWVVTVVGMLLRVERIMASSQALFCASTTWLTTVLVSFIILRHSSMSSFVFWTLCAIRVVICLNLERYSL